MGEHTPAPWWFADGKIGVGAHPNHGYIARLNIWPLRPDEQRANGHLLAAAPDLLEALTNLDTLLDFGDEDIEPGDPMTWPDDPSLLIQRFREARAAIAKAETPVSR